MAKNKLWSIGLILLFTLPCFAKKEITFKGEWLKVKSIIPNPPIRAWIEDNNKNLLLEFSSYLGTIEVTITSSTGDIIHKQSVDTKITSSAIISLSENINPNDIIYITDGNNIIYGNLFNN
ncbi:DUF3244 domain-containing protein [uncultured Parabacteroides sp.]|uniref:DUF3244 domain-containing protein n=3 Tax=uncultured Parabacteroides sp. TaxID=512312 RepID=UPI0025CCDFE0|nr:DUF3244 domain-containing protein [uncultured Parabacteroides sp.]